MQACLCLCAHHQPHTILIILPPPFRVPTKHLRIPSILVLYIFSSSFYFAYGIRYTHTHKTTYTLAMLFTLLFYLVRSWSYECTLQACIVRSCNKHSSIIWLAVAMNELYSMEDASVRQQYGLACVGAFTKASAASFYPHPLSLTRKKVLTTTTTTTTTGEEKKIYGNVKKNSHP